MRRVWICFQKPVSSGHTCFKVQAFTWEFSIAKAFIRVLVMVIIQGELDWWGVADGDQADGDDDDCSGERAFVVGFFMVIFLGEWFI